MGLLNNLSPFINFANAVKTGIQAGVWGSFGFGGRLCNLNGRENDERTQVDTNTNKITPGLNGA